MTLFVAQVPLDRTVPQTRFQLRATGKTVARYRMKPTPWATMGTSFMRAYPPSRPNISPRLLSRHRPHRLPKLPGTPVIPMVSRAGKTSAENSNAKRSRFRGSEPYLWPAAFGDRAMNGGSLPCIQIRQFNWTSDSQMSDIPLRVR